MNAGTEMNQFGLGIENRQWAYSAIDCATKYQSCGCRVCVGSPQAAPAIAGSQECAAFGTLLHLVQTDLNMWVPETFLKAAVKKCFRALTNLQSRFRTVYTEAATFPEGIIHSAARTRLVSAIVGFLVPSFDEKYNLCCRTQGGQVCTKGIITIMEIAQKGWLFSRDTGDAIHWGGGEMTRAHKIAAKLDR